jgi:hypothetical protein
VGVAFGYVGSIVGMIIVLPFVTGSIFSLQIPFLHAGGKEASFVPTAVLFFLFSVPLFLWVRESKVVKAGKESFLQSYRTVWESIKATPKYPGVLRFLIADYFFEDSVTTVILNIGIYCSIVLGLAEADITKFLIISTVSAVVGSFLIGKIAERTSLKNILAAIIGGWVVRYQREPCYYLDAWFIDRHPARRTLDNFAPHACRAGSQGRTGTVLRAVFSFRPCRRGGRTTHLDYDCLSVQSAPSSWKSGNQFPEYRSGELRQVAV